MVIFTGKKFSMKSATEALMFKLFIVHFLMFLQDADEREYSLLLEHFVIWNDFFKLLFMKYHSIITNTYI